VAILTGIGSSRTRVIQLTFGCKAGVTGFRLRHPVLTGIRSPTPAAAVEARGANPGTLPRDLWPEPGVRVAAANRAHRFMGAAQLLGQAAAAQRRQQDQAHLIRAQRAALLLLGWRLAAFALPDRPPILTAVAPIPAATATISIQPSISCSEAVAVTPGAFGWRVGHGCTARPALGVWHPTPSSQSAMALLP
jgi:hypothetical protein